MYLFSFRYVFEIAGTESEEQVRGRRLFGGREPCAGHNFKKVKCLREREKRGVGAFKLHEFVRAVWGTR